MVKWHMEHSVAERHLIALNEQRPDLRSSHKSFSQRETYSGPFPQYLPPYSQIVDQAFAQLSRLGPTPSPKMQAQIRERLLRRRQELKEQLAALQKKQTGSHDPHQEQAQQALVAHDLLSHAIEYGLKQHTFQHYPPKDSKTLTSPGELHIKPWHVFAEQPAPNPRREWDGHDSKSSDARLAYNYGLDAVKATMDHIGAKPTPTAWAKLLAFQLLRRDPKDQKLYLERYREDQKDGADWHEQAFHEQLRSALRQKFPKQAWAYSSFPSGAVMRSPAAEEYRRWEMLLHSMGKDRHKLSCEQAVNCFQQLDDHRPATSVVGLENMQVAAWRPRIGAVSYPWMD